jgi:hypothetical protein
MNAPQEDNARSPELDRAIARREGMRVRISHLKDQGKEDDLDGTTIEERWDMMWPLAMTAWAFMGEEDASAEGLPRRIARLIRRKR